MGELGWVGGVDGEETWSNLKAQEPGAPMEVSAQADRVNLLTFRHFVLLRHPVDVVPPACAGEGIFFTRPTDRNTHHHHHPIHTQK